MLRNQRTHNPKQPTPEARHSAGRPADRRGERLRGPTVQHGVEHALEEVLHGEEPQVLGHRVDRRKQQDRGAHEARREDHGPLAAERGDAVHDAAEEDAQDARGVGVDVACVGEGEGLGGVAVFEGEDAWEIETWVEQISMTRLILYPLPPYPIQKAGYVYTHVGLGVDCAKGHTYQQP